MKRINGKANFWRGRSIWRTINDGSVINSLLKDIVVRKKGGPAKPLQLMEPGMQD